MNRQKQQGRRNRCVWFEPPIYADESGERFQQIFNEVKAQSKNGLKQFLFWSTVCFVIIAIVWAKLYTMGAVAGVR